MLTDSLNSFCMRRCRQLYASVRNFYLEYPGVNGPSYPNCDDNGLFVTKKCDSTTPPRDCWCIDPVNGKKVAGSQFGNGNSEFELDCDHCEFLMNFTKIFHLTSFGNNCINP